MLPPRPPSPPSGPPRGTYFSRRKDADPSPPLPAITSIFASSKNFMALAGKRHANAERDEGEPGENVQSLADPRAPADPRPDPAREDRDRAEDHRRLHHEDRAEQRHLPAHVPGVRVHELRQEREEEKRDLRVHHVAQHALAVDEAEPPGAARPLQ